ncbi:MAG: hypothetical protein DCF29_12940 [Alphaproteobacteria bacterium]|nr:MAG: hypothetical protein DCF29_12940 [Alphaproteobacteria bacterium]
MPTPATPIQLKLDLGIEVEKEVGGVEMGVLENGIPYLTQRGLAAMSGAARSTIQELSQEWENAQSSGIFPRGRMQYFKDYLGSKGFDEPTLFIEINKDGTPHYAYPDIVGTAIIEYFAFEAQRTNETAIKNFRNLARYGLQQFIYEALGYKPEDKWALFNARVSLLKDSVPAGYFSVFKESTSLVVDLITAGLTVNQHTMPDGSVGGVWGAYWRKHELAKIYGERIPYPHYFPSEYAQSASNPQSAWAYPNEAWPAFQQWFREIYLRTKYPVYILNKANVLPGGKAEAARLAGMYEPLAIQARPVT